jgi:hypothetical protein
VIALDTSSCHESLLHRSFEEYQRTEMSDEVHMDSPVADCPYVLSVRLPKPCVLGTNSTNNYLASFGLLFDAVYNPIHVGTLLK